MTKTCFENIIDDTNIIQKDFGELQIWYYHYSKYIISVVHLRLKYCDKPKATRKRSAELEWWYQRYTLHHKLFMTWSAKNNIYSELRLDKKFIATPTKFKIIDFIKYNWKILFRFSKIKFYYEKVLF